MFTDRDAQIETLILDRDLESLKRIFFIGSEGRHVKDGVRHESELWDYKERLPDPGKGQDNDRSWSDLAALVLAFYNTHGGLIFFGVDDDFGVTGVRTRVDSKILNEKLRRYISDRIWVEFQRLFIRADQTYVAAAIVPPRVDRFERFTGNSAGFRYKYSPKQSAIRVGDSVRILTEDEVQARTRQLALPTIDNPFEVDEPGYRLLRPEFHKFVYRKTPCEEIESALLDPRTSVVSITGIGGTGKTALGAWATRRAYDRKDFAFIVSTTAKDRALTTSGILALTPQLSNYESLLDAILSVLQFEDEIQSSVDKKHDTVQELLSESGGLLFIDNLETIDDARIIHFLEHLPIGVKAITTSRVPRVKNYVRAVDPGFLTDDEITKFVLGYKASKPWVSNLKPEQTLAIGRAAQGVPLAIEWVLKRASGPGEALGFARSIQDSGSKKDELLEFCFRRVFDAMPEAERTILHILATVSAPLGLEPVIAATGLQVQTMDVLEGLRDDSLVQRFYDEDSGTYRFTLLAIVRAFVASDLALRPDIDRKIRKRLTDWFDATDIRDVSLRTAERLRRQGKQTSDLMLFELGIEAEKLDNKSAAKQLYERAYKTGNNWRAAHRLAEIYRHVEVNIVETLRWYERAALSAPRQGLDRALVFREWGNVLKASGEPDAIDLAISKFEEALENHPSDRLAAHSLATLYSRKGVFRKVIGLRTILWDKADTSTRSMSRDILIEAYSHFSDLVEVAKLRAWVPQTKGAAG